MGWHLSNQSHYKLAYGAATAAQGHYRLEDRMIYGIVTNYGHPGKRQRLMIWSGSFVSVFEADARQLPKGDGYMLTTYNGDKIRVTCPTPRNESNWQRVDDAISHALNGHYGGRE